MDAVCLIRSAQNNVCSIVYGTAEGSLGSFIEIPEQAYCVLELLQYIMDKNVQVDITQKRKSEYRSVKVDGKIFRSNRIIDGNFAHIFCGLPLKQKYEMIKKALSVPLSKEDVESAIIEIENLLNIL